jgi:hypothetical protein
LAGKNYLWETFNLSCIHSYDFLVGRRNVGEIAVSWQNRSLQIDMWQILQMFCLVRKGGSKVIKLIYDLSV